MLTRYKLKKRGLYCISHGDTTHWLVKASSEAVTILVFEFRPDEA